MATAIERDHNVNRLGIMGGIASIIRNLRREDAVAHADTLSHQRAAGVAPPPDKREEDEMLMVGGDLTIEAAGGKRNKRPAPNGAKPPSKIPAFILGAALTGLPAGAALATYYLTKGEPPKDDDTQMILDWGDPIEGENE